MAEQTTTTEPQPATGFTYLGDADANEQEVVTDEEEIIEETATEPEPEPTPTEEPTPAEPVTEPAPEPAQVEPTPAPVPVATAPAPPPPPVDPFEAIGLPKEDTLGRKLLEAHLAGDLSNFMRTFGTDWDKVPDIEIVRGSLEEKYAALEPRKRELLVRRDLLKYDTSNFDEDQRELAEAELELEAKVIRDGKKAEQASYTVPDRSAPNPEEAARRQQELDAQKAFETQLFSDPFLTQFETNRSVEVGEGEEAFKYAVPTMDLKAEIANPLEPFFIREEGKIPRFDVKGFAKAVAFYKNEADFVGKLAEHYKALGEKRKDAQLRNLGRGKDPAVPSGGGKGFTYLGDV